MTTSLKDLYKRCAERLKKDPQSLTDGERRQAFMDAVMIGERIEPFATISDIIDAQVETERKAYKIISDMWGANIGVKDKDA